MLFLFPPVSLTGACMMRACYEYLEGKDIVALVQEELVDKTFDWRVARKLSLFKVLGKPVFKPFKETNPFVYSLYIFLQPDTYKRMMLKRP